MSFTPSFRDAVRSMAAALLVTTTLGAAVPALAQSETPAPAAAAEKKNPDTVVATVNGAKITEADLGFVSEDFADQLSRVPEADRRHVLTDVLIDMQLIAQAGQKAGIDKTDAFQQRIDYLRTRALRNAYISEDVSNSVTDAEVKARYDAEIAKLPKQQEIHARHILVKTKAEAEEIIKELKKGADFATLAKEKSVDTGSGKQGGDLGYFVEGQMVKPFEQAAVALQVGKITDQPVETEFGWHVIKVEDKREKAPPSFDEVKGQIHELLLREKFETVLADLKKNAKIDIIDASAKPPAAPAAPATPAQ